MAELVTGEAVALDIRVARLASRGCAILLDFLVQLVLLNIAVYVTAMTALIADEAWAVGLTILAVATVLVGYPCAWETLSRGRTLGKMAVGLRVVSDDGGPIRFRQALVRALAGVIEFWTFYGSPALVTSLCNRRGKRLGDLFAGTIVIQERAHSMFVGPVAVMPMQLAGWARSLELSMLSDELAMTARQYLSRFWELLPEVRDSLGERIASQVVEVVSPPPPPGVRPEILLSAVLAERRHREEQRLAERRARLMRRLGWSPWAAASSGPWEPGPWERAPVPAMAVSGHAPTGPVRQGPPPPPPFSAPAPGQPRFLPPSDYGAGPYQETLSGPRPPSGGPYSTGAYPVDGHDPGGPYGPAGSPPHR
ncbi:putative RDD family membrane protein YckC [Actinomadura hallensis]|uniref:Putative RDD family membrane protein YckC n=1 Tax=Actinomadura hallensis TaxID=337895 RepID=A0A543I9Y8_9ACTN|nr:RDD family protein [Actinomadura hallensis]TQM67384.1 putative RDD family membrane protein YckC [Actinomadura hallensis]